MKNLLILTLLAFAVTFFLSCNDTSNPVESLDGATLAGAGGEGCATIQDGLLDSQGNPIVLGFDKWGYNYQAHIFNGLYENYSRPNPPVTASDFKLQMKWNAAWLSNTDCDGDGRLDRFYGFDSYIGSGAWLTNHMSGGDKKDKWTYFVKIVAVPVDAVSTGGMWYAADGAEIGPVIWGAFAIIQELETGSGTPLIYKSPVGPGFGKFKP